jgi:galactokinase/mevalonate kinase-like predicted kinase
MKKLFTVPSHFISYGKANFKQDEYYFNSDPQEGKIGSGGGTTYLLYNTYKDANTQRSLADWLSDEKRMIIHAGGQSRRLPAYAAVGKILTPIPIFKWKRGQRINQTLLDLQLPLHEEILSRAPAGLNTLIASGDVLIRNDEPLPPIPKADVVCFGLWEQPQKASSHGVFLIQKNDPSKLEFMLQKPTPAQIQELQVEHNFLIDIGIWLLSPKAMQVLFNKTGWNEADGAFNEKIPSYYDLYSTFGTALGSKPSEPDADISQLTVAIVPLPKAEFYHFGTSAELIESCTKLQGLVKNQQEIWQNKVKPHPELFTQNADTKLNFTPANYAIWIENSCIGPNWKLYNQHIITGVPANTWTINLPAETCLDIIPVGKYDEYCVRVYGFKNPQLPERLGKALPTFDGRDWFDEPVYPVFRASDLNENVVQLLIDDPGAYCTLAQATRLISAADIAEMVDLERQYAQRNSFLKMNLPGLARNWKQSVFYQLDLKHIAGIYNNSKISLSEELPESAPLLSRLHDQMFRSQVLGLAANAHADNAKESARYEANAFELLQQTIVDTARLQPMNPVMNVMSDQIVWGRSPIRLDLAGGWTDTPPYCLFNGGKVVNVAVELNGQPPLQVFIKPSESYHISIRSIDLGVKEDVYTYEDLSNYNAVGSAFSIPKAALCLAGFAPEFASNQYDSLEHQLKEFGAGIEISLLAAIPKGSGLGTSSILASTVLGAINDFCDLKWDKYLICSRTLVLEQMLTTGGGWQDQFGGVFGGIKLLESQPGILQQPTVRWAPDHVFIESASTILLYYTGITRVAKNILSEIVKGMFLNGQNYLNVLEEMRHHALNTYESIQQGDLQKVANAVGLSWQLNQRLDAGTNTAETQAIIDKVGDYLISCKLLGAGGGGYMLMFAKDAMAATRIREVLTQNPLNNRARFIEWGLSSHGFKVTRS